MTRAPRITGEDLLRRLLRAGFIVVRSSGSHFRLRNAAGRSTTVPRHNRTLKPKTLATILQQAGLTADDLAEL